MAVFFLFLRNVLLPIEILKIKILEHSDPPSQHFSVHKAFSHFFFCRGKVMLCHPAEWRKVLIKIDVRETSVLNKQLLWLFWQKFEKDYDQMNKCIWRKACDCTLTIFEANLYYRTKN